MDIAWHEAELAKIMCICGMDPRTLDTIEIDDILAKIEEVYQFDERKTVDVLGAGEFLAFPTTASNDLVRKTQMFLSFVTRRMWRGRHLARYQATL